MPTVPAKELLDLAADLAPAGQALQPPDLLLRHSDVGKIVFWNVRELGKAVHAEDGLQAVVVV